MSKGFLLQCGGVVMAQLNQLLTSVGTSSRDKCQGYFLLSISSHFHDLLFTYSDFDHPSLSTSVYLALAVFQ